jgi:hypothetical protein
MAVTAKTLYRGTPIFGTAPVKAYISNKAITTNLATITTNAAHGITQVGTQVTIQGVDSTFDGTYSIHSIPTTSTFTFVSTTTSVASAAVTPVGIATFNQPMTVGYTVSNKVVQNYVATLTSSSAHGLVVGDFIAVTIGDTIYDTKFAQVVAVPSTTLFSYLVSTQTSATTAVTQGSWGKLPALYSVPTTSTSTIITNIVATNLASSAATFSLNIDGQSILTSTALAANSSAFFDLKQVIPANNPVKFITGSASSSTVNFHVSGVEIV